MLHKKALVVIVCSHTATDGMGIVTPNLYLGQRTKMQVINPTGGHPAS